MKDQVIYIEPFSLTKYDTAHRDKKIKDRQYITKLNHLIWQLKGLKIGMFDSVPIILSVKFYKTDAKMVGIDVLNMFIEALQKAKIIKYKRQIKNIISAMHDNAEKSKIMFYIAEYVPDVDNSMDNDTL